MLTYPLILLSKPVNPNFCKGTKINKYFSALKFIFTLSEVEIPALSEVEIPALSEVEIPALSEVEIPALSEVEIPALSEVEMWAYPSVGKSALASLAPISCFRSGFSLQSFLFFLSFCHRRKIKKDFHFKCEGFIDSAK